MKRFIKSAIACVAAVTMIAAVAPITTYGATKTVTVSTQSDLNTAIENGAAKIIIKTTESTKFTIHASAKAAKVDFVVNAPNAKVANKASVKSLTVTDAKSFTEFGKNNAINITDSEVAITVALASEGSDITVAKSGADVKVVANGDIGSVTVAKRASVVINGSSDSKIDVKAAAAGAKISTSVPVAVTADEKASIVIAKGADGSTVTANASVTVGVKENATLAKVEVKAADATVNLLAKGVVTEVQVAENAAGAALTIHAVGKVANVTVDAKSDVVVKGTPAEAVRVTVNAADTTVKAKAPVDAAVNANAKVDLTAGAEGSKIMTAADVKAEVSNGTTEKVTITDSNGKESSVEAGKSETTTESKPVAGGSTGSTGGTGGSSGGGSDYSKTNPQYISVYNKEKQQWERHSSGDKITVNGYTGSYEQMLSLVQECQNAEVGSTVSFAIYDVKVTDVSDTNGATEVKLLYEGNSNDYQMTTTWDPSEYAYRINWIAGSKGSFGQ